jgi:hypothetical protein
MRNRNPDARREVIKRATLCIVWGIVAGVAYFGLIGQGVSAVAKATGLIPSSETIDSGLITLTTSSGGVAVPASLHALAIAALGALPIATVAIIVLGILLRVRPRQGLFAGLLIAAAAIGLVGALVFFLRVVATENNGKGFVVAFVTGIVVSLRQSYQRNPALVTLVVALVALIYLVLSNGTNIASIILTDVDVWLALVAYAVILFAGIGIGRYRRLIPRGK